MEFDPHAIQATAFEVFSAQDQALITLSISQEVKQILHGMLTNTIDQLGDENDWSEFDHTQVYGSNAQIYYEYKADEMVRLRQFYETANPTHKNLRDVIPADIQMYFARFTDKNGRKCLAVRKAVQFKMTIGKSLIYFLDGMLKPAPDRIFKLDHDFDFIIFSDKIAILRPRAFELIAELEQKLGDGIPKNIQRIQKIATYIDLEDIEDHARKHVTVRRQLAALARSSNLATVEKPLLRTLLKENKIYYTESSDGRIKVDVGQIAQLLKILDRRIYSDPLVSNNPDRYEANMRSKVD